MKGHDRLRGDRRQDAFRLSFSVLHFSYLHSSLKKAARSFNKRFYKERRRIENAFSRLKDFRRIATRYDRLARNFLASVCLAAALVWWI